MSSRGDLRIRKQFQQCRQQLSGRYKPSIEVEMCEDHRHWKAYIEGVEDTPYKGGLYQIDIIFPIEYPLKPPTMIFETKIWHPNVNIQTGGICIDILKENWTPALPMRATLISVQSFLGQAWPDEPLNLAAAKQFKNDRNRFNQHAHQWTNKYATSAGKEEIIEQLTKMGFTYEQVKNALSKNMFDEEMSLQTLLNS